MAACQRALTSVRRLSFLRDGKIVGFRVADQEAIVAQEE
jgi:hypothetical protein